MIILPLWFTLISYGMLPNHNFYHTILTMATLWKVLKSRDFALQFYSFWRSLRLFYLFSQSFVFPCTFQNQLLNFYCIQSAFWDCFWVRIDLIDRFIRRTTKSCKHQIENKENNIGIFRDAEHQVKYTYFHFEYIWDFTEVHLCMEWNAQSCVCS